jgi:NAD(P)-dependent dehydrogenase (short-subunit alcohol dehydrogenase family)
VTIDVSRRVALVTGASSGIGQSTAVRLAALGWQVIGVGRDPRRSAAAEAEIAAAARDGGFAMVRADFTLMAEVKRVADEVRNRTGRLDVLVNNAGGVRDRQVITAEGTEATFAANYLAPFLLTRELMPLLRGSAASRPSGTTRVIAVSSSAHRVVEGLNWDDLQSLGGDFRPVLAYGRAKLANILFTRELARRAAPDGIVALAMHPGVVASNFASHGDEAMRAHMAAADTVPPDEPAETLAWLATGSAGDHRSGRYFYRKAEETPAAAAQDEAAARHLWAESEMLLARLGF